MDNLSEIEKRYNLLGELTHMFEIDLLKAEVSKIHIQRELFDMKMRGEEPGQNALMSQMINTAELKSLPKLIGITKDLRFKTFETMKKLKSNDPKNTVQASPAS